LAKVDLEFLGRQIGLLIEGQREIRDRLAAIEGDVAGIKARLAETASRDLLLRVLQSFEGQVELAEIRTKLLQETLTARLAAAERRIGGLEGA
jgi:DNA-binding FrmR family transcriptional regulator